MLKGQEGLIVKNSVEALYKFADKSVENKNELFKKNSIPLLFDLLLKNKVRGTEIFGDFEFIMIKKFAAIWGGICRVRERFRLQAGRKAKGKKSRQRYRCRLSRYA